MKLTPLIHLSFRLLQPTLVTIDSSWLVVQSELVLVELEILDFGMDQNQHAYVSLLFMLLQSIPRGTLYRLMFSLT